MGIFTRLFKGGTDGEAPDDAADEREQIEPALEPAFATGGALMSTKREEPPAAKPRTPLPGLPRTKEPPPPPREEKPVTVTFKKATDRNDATMIAAAPPPPAAPRQATTARPNRPKPDSIEMALDEVVLELSVDPPEAEPAPGVSTPTDLAAVKKMFEEVAVAHVAQVRDVMLELRYGEADTRWIELTKPALQSLRSMAKQMDLVDLTTSLDAFIAGVDAAVAGRVIDDAGKTELLGRYQRLVELIPQAFELDAERDRREPIIVEALLAQIEGVERPTIDKLFSVGLNRLAALIGANAGDVAAVSGMRPELAEKIVEHFKAYRSTTNATVAAPDPQGERRKLADLLIMLSLQNDDFNKVSSEWTDEANAKKRTLRKQRDQTFQQIRVALARLGQHNQLAQLDRMSLSERIATIDRWLSAQQA
jgi:hypothetical protein